MSEPGPIELPIFELGLAIVPGEQVPLHIFERRYRLMIDACIERDSPFGIVLRDGAGARSAGCSAEVTDVVERYEDGRLDIVVTGSNPFRVLDRFDAADWPAAHVVLATADGQAAPGRELRAARAAFAELLAAVGAGEERAAAAAGAYEVAAQVELPPADKQALLEAGGERERLVALERSLRRLLAGLAESRALSERAKGNGHAPGRIGPGR